jgi:hypothetical protein
VTSDILEVIDAATGCQQCGGPLEDSPSSDFCDPGCQRRWHARHAHALDPWSDDAAPVYPGYDAARWRPEGSDEGSQGEAVAILLGADPGVSFVHHIVDQWRQTVQRARQSWRLPRSTGDLDADTRAWRRAANTARTSAQVAACNLRQQELHVRRRAQWARDWRLPRSTGNLHADKAAANQALLTATTDSQRAAAKLRLQDIERRRAELFRDSVGSFSVSVRLMVEGFRQGIQQVSEAFALFGQGLVPHFTAIDEIDHQPEGDSRAAAMARALEARRNRNTGPAQRLGRHRVDVPGARR